MLNYILKLYDYHSFRMMAPYGLSQTHYSEKERDQLTYVQNMIREIGENIPDYKQHIDAPVVISRDSHSPLECYPCGPRPIGVHPIILRMFVPERLDSDVMPIEMEVSGEDSVPTKEQLERLLQIEDDRELCKTIRGLSDQERLNLQRLVYQDHINTIDQLPESEEEIEHYLQTLDNDTYQRLLVQATLIPFAFTLEGLKAVLIHELTHREHDKLHYESIFPNAWRELPLPSLKTLLISLTAVPLIYLVGSYPPSHPTLIRTLHYVPILAVQLVGLAGLYTLGFVATLWENSIHHFNALTSINSNVPLFGNIASGFIHLLGTRLLGQFIRVIDSKPTSLEEKRAMEQRADKAVVEFAPELCNDAALAFKSYRFAELLETEMCARSMRRTLKLQRLSDQKKAIHPPVSDRIKMLVEAARS